ncbi:MAG: GNAT family N-acetyltransferase [Thermoleophilia bacterium]
MLADARQAVFGAFVGGELVGFVGVAPSDRPKTSHRGDIWGLYVEPAHRRSGVGRSLVEHAVVFARSLGDVAELDLTVTDGAPHAAALYRSLGFEEWGHRPDSIRVDGVPVGERHMRLRL